jgi:ferredoxin-NAD(P)+ reductase (naphthalene dioxygenase ferredoxin-specific)
MRPPAPVTPSLTVIPAIPAIILADCPLGAMMYSRHWPELHTMEIRIEPLNRVIRVEAGANLLESLQAAQVPMSYSCMAGRCGTCRCRVLDGHVLESGTEHRTPLYVRDSYVLACRTYITEPCTIQIPEPDEIVVHPARIVKATVTALEDLAHDIKRLVLKPAKPVQHSPGQYVQLQFTPEHIRPYSMAGLWDDDSFEFHVRLVPEGRVTRYIANDLKVGAAVRVSGPLGSAYLRQKHTGPMLCIAGGTGLAPILSILRGVVTQEMRNPVHVYFGVRAPRDIYGLEWLTDLSSRHPSLKLHVVVTSGGDSRVHRCGLVTEAIEQDFSSLQGWRAYLCGSPPMVEAATMLIRNKGILADHIYADAFYPQGT